MKLERVAAAVALLALGSPMRAPAADGRYRQLKEIAIGGEGGWD